MKLYGNKRNRSGGVGNNVREFLWRIFGEVTMLENYVGRRGRVFPKLDTHG